VPVVPTISFTTNLRRHVDCPAATVGGATVRAALDQYFAAQPQVRSYVLDEQGAVRRHVAVFVGRHQVLDPISLSDPIDEATEIHVMQALSGG
jgi:sulfur-carrier protein